MIYIETLDKVSDYQEAIYLTCSVLQRNSVVSEHYYSAIMDNIKNYGGYFYLGEGVCMPHAQAKEEVICPGACVLKLQEPVDFFGKPVKLFFTLAADDTNQHAEYLKGVARACSSKEKIQTLLETENEMELRRLLEGEV